MSIFDQTVGWDDWRWQISHSCRGMQSLMSWAREQGFSANIAGPDLQQTVDAYQMGITPYYFSLIKSFDNTDPIYQQIIPTLDELTILDSELDDPIADEAPARGSRPLKALVHRYPNRVLLFPTALCAVYCRFCFRKRLVGDTTHNAREEDLQAAYDYINANKQITEVILTGGDPLTLGDRQLLAILNSLVSIPHLRTLRIHTRMPVVNPFRLTPELGLSISKLEKPVWISAHFNHAVELTPEAIACAAGWINLGIPFLNQSVLLRGVNDSVSSMKELLLALIEARIKPYYLHQADLVKGTSHLRAKIAKGLDLLAQLQGELPGYAIPHYMLDRPEGLGKIPLQNQYDVNHPDKQ